VVVVCYGWGFCFFGVFGGIGLGGLDLGHDVVGPWEQEIVF
jgi:hypothetical protein